LSNISIKIKCLLYNYEIENSDHMTKQIPQLSLLTDKERQTAVRDIMAFFATERDEEIGVIAAEEFLDMVLESIAPTVYNRAVDESKDFLSEKLDAVLLDLDITLKK